MAKLENILITPRMDGGKMQVCFKRKEIRSSQLTRCIFDVESFSKC